MDPRRSSRARTSQPAPPPHTNSTTSSTSLSRAERSTRSNNKTQSPQRSSVQRSVSMDDTDSNTRPEGVAPRRSRRGNDSEKDEKIKQQEEEQQGQVLEDDVTRCICGHADYPGPPASIRDFAQRRPSKAGSKDGGAQTDDPNTSDTLSDDVGNFFIQCDNCHVWQHGGCVGLTDESLSPEFYFCEECKPEFHKLIKASDGTKSTRYLPVLEALPARSSSLSSQDTSRRKDGKRLSEKESIKRRATMNSRRTDEEDEMLRRAIEESKGETSTLGKRTRADSEENKHGSKRQRTSASSPSTLSNQSRSPSQLPGEDPTTKSSTNGNAGGRKSRGGAARNHQDKEVRDRQKEIAAQRAEAARKREARSERRRGEDSPPPTPEPTSSKLAPSSTANPKSNAADAASSHKPNASNHRKTGRPPARRGRLGRNQYTRDLPANGEVNGSPRRDHSNDANVQSGSPSYGTRGAPNGINGESGRSSRPKYHNPTRTSMNEMKRRVAAILEFVNRMQTERPSQRSSASGSDKDGKGGSTPNGSLGLNASAINSVLVLAVEAGLSSGSRESSEKNFTEMAAGEMMETLTKELVQWQSLYGKYGEK